MCPNASENGQISPSTIVRAARGDSNCPNCTHALQGAPKTTNVQASSGAIWGIPAITSRDRTMLSMEKRPTKHFANVYK